jgi:hypothetical protein
MDRPSDIAHAIQLAVAPVFLLSAVGVTLSVLTNRLGRIIDRARVLEDRVRENGPPAAAAHDHAALATLSRRAKLVNLALSLSTSCALLVCLVIALLFLESLFGADLSSVVALLFVGAMLAFIGGLVAFLREIFVATQSLRIGERVPPK